MPNLFSFRLSARFPSRDLQLLYALPESVRASAVIVGSGESNHLAGQESFAVSLAGRYKDGHQVFCRPCDLFGKLPNDGASVLRPCSV